MSFPTTLAEWVILLQNPIVAAFAIFMVFRALNKKPGLFLFGRWQITIADWSDQAKIALAFIITLAWSILVAALDKSFVNFTVDTWPLIIARAGVLWISNQAVYAVAVKTLGPVGSKLLGGGTLDPGELIGEALGTLQPGPDPTKLAQGNLSASGSVSEPAA